MEGRRRKTLEDGWRDYEARVEVRGELGICHGIRRSLRVVNQFFFGSMNLGDIEHGHGKGVVLKAGEI